MCTLYFVVLCSRWQNGSHYRCKHSSKLLTYTYATWPQVASYDDLTALSALRSLRQLLLKVSTRADARMAPARRLRERVPLIARVEGCLRDALPCAYIFMY